MEATSVSSNLQQDTSSIPDTSTGITKESNESLAHFKNRKLVYDRAIT